MSISPILKIGLQKLEMINQDNKANNNLKFVQDIDNEDDYYIKFHLQDAKKYEATAVYFKYFENRPPVPQIYIYEEQKNIDKLYKRLWSSCKVPLFFVFEETQIKIFNSLSKETIKSKEAEPIEIIKLASKINKNFKAKMFDTGDFWNSSSNKFFKQKNSAYSSLLDKLEFERDRLITKRKLSIPLTNSLLIKSILLKYLEEKKVFEKSYWSKFLPKANSFIDLVNYNNNDNQALINLFEDLSQHFNGGIFKLSNKQNQELSKADLTEFRYFLQPNIDKDKQLHFWDLYSFADLPIELISNIYELFLTEDEKKGVVYTPSILVDFMIDELMPLNEPKDNFKIIDFACGSGVFLVGAFKRMVQYEMIRNDFKIPNVKTLKSLITNNIFGIDKVDDAIEVAKFSLSLALCEIIDSNIIWNELRFDDLSKNGNLIAKDFFETLNNKQYPQLNNFDLVIGNPPFKKVENEAFIKDKNRPDLPDKQLAYLFLEKSFELLKPNALVGLVQPSGILYNNNVEKFRKYLFEKFNLRQVIDFTGLNQLYNGSKKDSKGKKVSINVPTTVLFFENKTPNIDDSEVLHLTVRQSYQSKEKIYFDLSYYDFHWISYSEAIENKYIWKCNLVGGSRVVNIINRLSQYPTLKNYLDDKKENNNWEYCEGYSLGNKKHKTDYLYNHLALLPKSDPLDKNGIDWNKTYIIQETHFEAPRTQKLFEAPLVIIREVFDKENILLDYSEKDIIFTNRYIGISASGEDKEDLKMIVRNLQDFSQEYIFNIISTSSQVGIKMATPLLKKDIDNLPYPKNVEDIKLSPTEKYFAEDTIDYMLDWINGSQKSPIFNNANNTQLKEYQEIYCDTLNSVYKKFKPLQYKETEQFIIMPFYYEDMPSEYLTQYDISDNNLKDLIVNEYSKNINISRVVKIYDKKVIYLIKPKQLRFWLKSIAIRDVDDTIDDLIDMRY